MPVPEIKEMLEAGVHFGHLTKRWNPKMKKFILTERNGIYVLDLAKTQDCLTKAIDAVRKIRHSGKSILFVGTKKTIKDCIKEEAVRCGQHYVTERWLGGMLTNYSTVRKSIKRLEEIEKMETDGLFKEMNKKEVLTLNKERAKLEGVFSGIRNMKSLPGALFIVDSEHEEIAVHEANRLKIPVIAIVDTNSDPDKIAYPDPRQRRRHQERGPPDPRPLRLHRGHPGSHPGREVRRRRSRPRRGAGRGRVMADVSAQAVAQLREKTGIGFLQCKKALAETGGDMEKAIEYLRKQGVAVAAKRSGKETKEGKIVLAVGARRRRRGDQLRDRLRGLLRRLQRLRRQGRQADRREAALRRGGPQGPAPRRHHGRRGEHRRHRQDRREHLRPPHRGREGRRRRDWPRPTPIPTARSA